MPRPPNCRIAINVDSGFLAAHEIHMGRVLGHCIGHTATKWATRGCQSWLRALERVKYIERITEMEPAFEKMTLERDTAKGMVRKLKLVNVELAAPLYETYRTYRESRQCDAGGSAGQERSTLAGRDDFERVYPKTAR